MTFVAQRTEIKKEEWVGAEPGDEIVDTGTGEVWKVISNDGPSDAYGGRHTLVLSGGWMGTTLYVYDDLDEAPCILDAEQRYADGFNRPTVKFRKCLKKERQVWVSTVYVGKSLKDSKKDVIRVHGVGGLQNLLIEEMLGKLNLHDPNLLALVKGKDEQIARDIAQHFSEELELPVEL